MLILRPSLILDGVQSRRRRGGQYRSGQLGPAITPGRMRCSRELAILEALAAVGE
jgi:hypothetical protein